jgi:hypothetical protein
MIDKILKVLNDHKETAKAGSDGDYDTFNAVYEDEFNDVAQELVNLFSLHIVSSSADFKENARPLLKYLAENHHPHTTAIITSTSIELVEGIKAENKIYDYIQD